MSRGKQIIRPPTGATVRADFSKHRDGKRVCYYVRTLPEADGNFHPSLVIEDVPGHYPTELKWGPDRELARKRAIKENHKLGVSDEDAVRIVLSSMAKTFLKR